MKTTTSMTHPFYRATLSFRLKLFVLLCLVALADFLFYGKSMGISVAIFIITLGLGIIIANSRRVKTGVIIRSVFILLLSVLPIIEDLNILSAGIGIFGLIFFVIQLNNRLSDTIMTNISNAVQLTLSGLPRSITDSMLSRKITRRLNIKTNNRHNLLNWVLPIVCTIGFLFLFSEANPIISEWLANLGSMGSEAISGFRGKRLVFWALIGIGLWPLLRGKLYNYFRKEKEQKEISIETRVRLQEEYPSLSELLSFIINEHSVLRSLVLFNILFGLQSVLDITYLWNGASLPAHMTYAEYSHRGAYPLIATALLAAAFVLISLRPGSDTNSNRLIRALVYIWIMQNILLVTSSILRLDMYISVYQLTYLRVAAFIWMGLVAIGLASIILRILLNRSNDWLIRFNLVTLGITLYACSFINFGHIISHYNISKKDYARIDANHLCKIGEPALPAIIKVGAVFEVKEIQPYKRSQLKTCAKDHLTSHEMKLADWRSWGYRTQRLSLYLKELKNANSVEKAAP